MTEFHKKIASSIENYHNEIIEFIQSAIHLPSLANNEGPVQELIAKKLSSFDLHVDHVPIYFETIKEHPAFYDDGFSPDSRYNIVGSWDNNGNGRSLILNGHVDVVPTGPQENWSGSP